MLPKLRRKSSGFSRGASKFRGVTRHHQHGRWEARIGRVLGEGKGEGGGRGEEGEQQQSFVGVVQVKLG